MRTMWKSLVVALLVLGGVAALSDEVGVRIRVDPDPYVTSMGWLALSGSWGTVALSGRAEADLVPVSFRSVSGSARLPWGWGAGRATVAHTGAGRTQLLTELEAKNTFSWDTLTLSLSVGTQARAAWTTLGRSSTMGAWSVFRAEALPWWAEARSDVSLPWTDVRWSVAAGVEGKTWAQLRVEGSGLRLEATGVEWGGEEGPWSTSMFVGVLPRPSQSATVRWGDEAFRLLARLSVRSGAQWTAQVGANGARGPVRWSGTMDLRREGWRGISAEVRWTL